MSGLSRGLAVLLGVALGSDPVATLGAGTTDLPAAPVRNVVDTYFGVRVDDPYRYMESVQDPLVATWMKAQSDYTNTMIQSIPGRKTLLSRVQELDDSVAATTLSVSWLPNGRVFYVQTRPGDNQAKLYARAKINGPERLIVDPDEISRRSGRTVSLHFYVASPTGRYVAYGLSDSGSEQVYMSVMHVATGHVLGPAVDRTSANAVGTKLKWLPDETGFFFNRKQELKPGMPATDKYLNSNAYFFRIATSAPDSQPVFGNGNPAAPRLEPDEFPFIVLPPSSDYVLALSHYGVRNQISLYTARRSELRTAHIRWRPIVTQADNVVDFAVYRDELYLVSGKGAPRYRVLRTSLSHPDLAKAAVVVPQSKAVVSAIEAAADGIYVKLIDGGPSRLLRIAYRSQIAERIALPFEGSLRLAHTSSGKKGAVVELAGWVRSPHLYYYDPNTKQLHNLGLQPVDSSDARSDLTAEEVNVRSHDGVEIPLSIVHKRGLALDANNPTILTGYGAYGFLQEPRYSPNWLAWFERGGIYAIAHVRGGGEYGEEWHLAGRGESKHNSWKDFIACAEYLVARGYTKPEHLGIQGTSAGGILVGRALTERPDLFAAAVPTVGVLDAIRLELTPTGSANAAEYGSSKTEAGFRGSLEMSAYYHVREGIPYPGVLLVQGVNDPRVLAWQSTKMAARLQAATTSARPILLRLDYDAGHGVGSSTLQRRLQFVDTLTFMLWQFGDPEFQPTLR